MSSLPSGVRARTYVAALLLVLTCGLATPQASPTADCGSALSIRHFGGPAFGVDGDIYRVEIGLGAGSITEGEQNVLIIEQVRYFLDCTFQGLPGCTDDGGVVAYVGNITTTCGTDDPGFWTVSVGANTVDFTAGSPIVIPAQTPPFPGFCQLQFSVMLVNTADARDDLPQTPNRVESVVQLLVAACDNGLPSSGLQTAAFDLCPVCDDDSFCTTDTCDQATAECIYTPTVDCDDGNPCTSDDCDAVGSCVYAPVSGTSCDDGSACTEGDTCLEGACMSGEMIVYCPRSGCVSSACNPETGVCEVTGKLHCDDDDRCTYDSCHPVLGCRHDPIICQDGNPGTIDDCDPSLGCVFRPKVRAIAPPPAQRRKAPDARAVDP